MQYFLKIIYFGPIRIKNIETFLNGENPYKLIADELAPGKIGFDKNWASKHTLSV